MLFPLAPILEEREATGAVSQQATDSTGATHELRELAHRVLTSALMKGLIR
jgi:hypothetical protein